MRWLLVVALVATASGGSELHLTTDDEGYLTVIQGFATQLQCVLNTCSPNVVWYKDDILLFNGTIRVNASTTERPYKLAHKVDVDYEKGCSGSCSDSSPCASGSSCIDNQCCACSREDFTLVLTNLTFDDSGRYKCQIANQSELLEFQVEVLESGLRGGFHENISYDHSQCCQEKGISPLCRAMCKPSEMAEHHFDPTSCKTDDYKNFLTCATDNGTRSHVHCCKTQLVPSFCYDFCSGDFQMLRRSHRLCLYYLPEIFECYNRAYLPYPDAPEDVQVNAVEHDKLSVCWAPSPVHDNNRHFPVTGYTVSYKEIPNFPLFGGEVGLPLLTGDYTDIGDTEDSDYTEETTEEATKDAKPERAKRESEQPISFTDPSTMQTFSIRRRRASFVVVTRDEESNTTAIREFNFQHLNTTETCVTLSDLRTATRYIVLVTARNDYGSSVPSVRALASTNVHTSFNNETAPDAMKCCTSNNVRQGCAEKMCQVNQPPTSLETITIATTCREEWPKVAPCIADQRNHTACCVRKGVQKECLPICAGSTATLGVHSVLCLSLDIQAIYQCIREGYESHPSAPVNVTVRSVTESTAEIRWEEPDTNAHLVETYTLFIRKSEHGAVVRQVHNAVSPHTEMGLDADTEYSVAVQSNSANGLSLPSTAIIFSTKPIEGLVCPIGEPLLVSEGRPFLCNHENPCPSGFFCTDDGDEAFCCQKESSHSDADFQECCVHQGVSEACMPSCYFNATLPETCKSDLNKWVQCASEGQDHSRCCEQQKIPKECLTACRHPFQVADPCIASVSLLSVCFAGRSGGAPQAVKNLEVSLIQHDSATLSWEDLDSDVHMFTVEVYNDNQLVNSTNVTVDIIRLERLQPQKKYSARVIASNEHGTAPPSWNITFSTLPDTDTDGDPPRQPMGLHITWNQGTRVNVSWTPVTKRRNEQDIDGPVTYTVYYVDSENNNQWTTLRSNVSWVVLSELRRDALYSVYVTSTVNEKTSTEKTSRSSSVITLIAQPDTLSLPEPQLIFNPDHADSVYIAGEKFGINCSVQVAADKKEHLNMDLNAGTHSAVNDHGQSWVWMEVEADSSLDTASCAVTDTDGRQNVAMKHILVKFGPVATMDRDKVRAFDDQTAEITCTVKGFPAPNIRFEKGGKPVAKNNRLSVKLVKMNTYKATLHIPNASGQADFYTCIAEKNGNSSTSDKTELIISREILPVNPRLILSCCEDEKIEGDCLQACSIGKVPELGNCSRYSSSLLKCANDVRDHADCCSLHGVPKQCLPLCSGDSHVTNFDCSPYAVSIMGCFVRGHEDSPLPVTSVSYEVVEKGKIKVKWEDAAPADHYQYYAVYYKKKDDDKEDYKMKKTLSRSVELSLPPGEAYDVGVVAANAFGYSPLVFLDVSAGGRSADSKQESGSSAWYIFLILLACLVVILGIVILGRRRELPAPLGKLVGRPQVPRNQPTVAFENPAYGSEVEIRGLGHPEWQQQDLQASTDAASASAANANSNEYRNGMRYSKLEST